MLNRRSFKGCSSYHFRAGGSQCLNVPSHGVGVVWVQVRPLEQVVF